MVRCLVVAFSCLVVAASSPGQTDAPQEVQKQSIQGKVVEAKSGQPIRKVYVEVRCMMCAFFSPGSAMTSADGTFAIENLQPGRYTVTLERTGFVQASSRREQATFALQPGQSLDGLVFKLQAAGLISGKIVDVDGEPMAHVVVQAAMAGTVRGAENFRSDSATTNDLGEYRIADLRPGKYLIFAQIFQTAPVRVQVKDKPIERLVYVSTYYPGTVDKSRATEVAVRAGEEVVVNFGVLMTHTHRISGTVAGVPNGAILNIDGLEAVVGTGSAVLREGSHFRFENVLPGTYVGEVLVFKPGEEWHQTLVLTPSIEVTETDVDGIQLQAEPGGQIHGVVRLDTKGKFDWTQLKVDLVPVKENMSKTVADIIRSAMSRPRAAVSNDGTFELKNVPNVPGANYQLLIGANSDSFRDYYTKSVILGGRDVADSGFAVNGDVYLDVVVSPKGATIEGTVVDSNGQPVPYSKAAVVPDSEHRFRPDSYQLQRTDEHGHFIARGLPPGSYVALAFEESWDDTQQPEFFKTFGDKGEKIELEEGTRKSVTAKVIPVETEAP
jgi:hypothetical protein